MSHLPNIDKLGRGFNIIDLDPFNLSNDDAEKLPVFAIDEHHTRDEPELKVPGISHSNSPGGSSHTVIVANMTVYEHEVSEFVEVESEVGIPVLSFSNSSSFEQFRKKNQSENTITIVSYSKRRSYNAKIKSGLDVPKLDPSFQKNVIDLPVEYNESSKQEYFAFFEEFGTHYSSEINMGGIAKLTKEITEQKYLSLLNSKVEIKATAEGAFKELTGQVSGQIKTGNTDTSQIEVKFESTDLSYQGGVTSIANFAEWDDTVDRNPALIKVVLSPIFNALELNKQTEEDNATKMQQGELNTKKANLESALNDYLLKNGIQYPDDIGELKPVYEWVPEDLTLKGVVILLGPNSNYRVNVDDKFLKSLRRLCIDGSDPNKDGIGRLSAFMKVSKWKRNRIAFFAFSSSKGAERTPIYEFGPLAMGGVFGCFQYQKQGVAHESQTFPIGQAPAFYVPTVDNSKEVEADSNPFLMKINKYSLYSYPGNSEGQDTGRPHQFGSISKVFFNSYIFADANYVNNVEGENYEFAPNLFDPYYAYSGIVKFTN